jgi:ABC-type uncharacterized transport system ATPase subunit
MALAGVRAPASGEIVIEDTAPWGLSAAQRDLFRGRRIGLVFQSFHLIDAVSVATNLALAARCAGLPPDSGRMDQLLETLQIAELRRRRADRISHGQAVCMYCYCPPGQPNEVVEVLSPKAIEWTDKITTVTGKLSLINDGEKALFFKIENAQVGQ